MTLEEELKALAKGNGAALVGIASRERLASAPPSANPDYVLLSTSSIISIAIPLNRKIIRNYLSKKDWLSLGTEQKRIYQKLYSITDRLAELLRHKGFEAKGIDANNIYRPEPGGTDAINRVEMIPDFSHRYAAVAAGLGHLGWSGNLVTPQFGAAVFLSSILTSAVLRPNPLLRENPCNKCKLCTTVCPVEMIDKENTVSVIIDNREFTYAKKDNNARCIIGCGGHHGLGPNREWSTWSPYRVKCPLPEEKEELIALSRRLREANPFYQGNRAFLTQRERCLDPNEIYPNTCCNCALICWEKIEDRMKNAQMVKNSGVVALSAGKGRIAIPYREVEELDTPYKVKVAVPRSEYSETVAQHTGYKPADIAWVYDMDYRVMSFIYGKTRN